VRPRGGRSPASSVGRTLGELGDQLDALRFAAGERRALLAEREIAEAHVLQQRRHGGSSGAR
jgi:hypothetical protein